MKVASVFVLAMTVLTASAFAPASPALARRATVPRTPMKMAQETETDMTWVGKSYPPSKVLGPFLENSPSGPLGLCSLLFFAVGLYCNQANDFTLQTLDGGLPNVDPKLIVGANLLPVSWGLHVASWIQKQNGK